MRKLSLLLSATSAAALLATASTAGAQVLGGGGGLSGSVGGQIGGVTGSAGGTVSGSGRLSSDAASRVHGTTDNVYHKASKTSARARGAAYSAGDAATDTARQHEPERLRRGLGLRSGRVGLVRCRDGRPDHHAQKLFQGPRIGRRFGDRQSRRRSCVDQRFSHGRDPSRLG